MNRKLIVGAIAAGALILSTGTAFALSNSSDDTSAATPSVPTFASTSAPTSESTPESTATTESSPGPTLTSEPTQTRTPESTSVPAGSLSAADASRIVVERVGGTVHEVEREVEHGRVEWKVEVTARDGNTYDIRVDAETGAVTRVDQDTRATDDHQRGRDDRGRGGEDEDRHGHGGDDH
ncbi:PepSY domain-containing protein [Actinophytocola sp.]|uniref:PepSY domain-containing protein n=1 Tax=Actinophytocola sp. TaxID=1872138 RepID=UPI002D6B9BA7|nr:PepSY domain-containing protein [Actinophytocola sp.]HYQ69561.1 PepSY domain-containing protein [Actinophytocola sp.]